MATPLRAAIYTRISDDKSGEQAGVQRQRAACEKLAADRGLTVVAVFEDNSRSAMTGKRPAYGQLLDAVRAGEVDCVLVWAIDRLYRMVKDLLELTTVLGSVPVFAVKSGDTDLSTADGRLKANMLGSVAQHESEKKAERVRDAAEYRARAGGFNGGRRRFGYTHRDVDIRTGKPTGPLLLVPAEAEAIAWAYQHVLSGGTLESVAREFKARELVGPYGAPIGGVALRDILLRPMNAGLAVYHGELVGTTDTPPIVTEEMFLAVRAILTDPRRRTTVGRPPKTLLSSVLRCAVCGARMSARNHNPGPAKGGVKVGIYACRVGHVTRTRARLDAHITELVLGRIERQADMLTRPVGMLPTSVSEAVRESEKLRDRLAALAALVASGDLDPADYATSTSAVRARLAEVDSRVIVATGHHATAALAATGDVRKAWTAPTTTDAQRRQVIGEHIARIDLDRGKPGRFATTGIHITWAE